MKWVGVSAGCFLCVGKSQDFLLSQATWREAVVFKVFTVERVAFVQMAFYVKIGHKAHPKGLLWGGESLLAHASWRQLHRAGLKITGEFRFPVCVPADVLSHRTQHIWAAGSNKPLAVIKQRSHEQ